MAVDVRELKEKDLDQLTDLWYELATMHEDIMDGYELSQEPKKHWKELMEKSLDKEGMATFVAEEKEIIGFVTAVHRKRPAFFADRDVGFILDLFVMEGRRNQGVGSKLVEKAEGWIKRKGLKTAVLTVSPENPVAVKFWEDRGFDNYLLKKRKEL